MGSPDSTRAWDMNCDNVEWNTSIVELPGMGSINLVSDLACLPWNLKVQHTALVDICYLISARGNSPLYLFQQSASNDSNPLSLNINRLWALCPTSYKGLRDNKLLLLELNLHTSKI